MARRAQSISGSGSIFCATDGADAAEYHPHMATERLSSVPKSATGTTLFRVSHLVRAQSFPGRHVKTDVLATVKAIETICSRTDCQV